MKSTRIDESVALIAPKPPTAGVLRAPGPRQGLMAMAVAVGAVAPLGAAHAVDWPSGYSKCADEGGTCKVGDTARQVSFGVKDKWVIKSLKGDVACT